MTEKVYKKSDYFCCVVACFLCTGRNTCPKVCLYSLKTVKGAVHGSMLWERGQKAKAAAQQGQVWLCLTPHFFFNVLLEEKKKEMFSVSYQWNNVRKCKKKNNKVF